MIQSKERTILSVAMMQAVEHIVSKNQESLVEGG
jgi:hypothetical protein